MLSLPLNLKSLLIYINKYICPSFAWDVGYQEVKQKQVPVFYSHLAKCFEYWLQTIEIAAEI